MKKYRVGITATVTKVIIVEFDETELGSGVDQEDHANELANDEFSPDEDATEGTYDQRTDFVEEIELD